MQGAGAEITSFGVLSECLEVYLGYLRSISIDGMCLSPKKGFEDMWDGVSKRVSVLKGMMERERYGDIKRATRGNGEAGSP